MRTIHNEERVQRGCLYCADAIKPKTNGKEFRQRMCPYEECPYHELDGFESYADYMKKTNKGGFAKLMDALKNVTSCE